MASICAITQAFMPFRVNRTYISNGSLFTLRLNLIGQLCVDFVNSLLPKDLILNWRNQSELVADKSSERVAVSNRNSWLFLIGIRI